MNRNVSSIDGEVLMTDVDDNSDISPDGGEECFSDGAPTVPETCADGPTPLMDASTVAMGPASDENAPFPKIDGYEIVEAMQAGGQGKLYRARELTPAGREVVLKFPRAGVLSSDRAVALFENEVQKAASLDHPNIARIYSSGLYDRMPFYSMEFIDGVDLGKHVKEANLGQREILELVRTICLAVQHAHQRQIVHRDLKPANIMVTRDGAVAKLLDFGLAIEETELQATIDRGVGTLVYMSPEQAAYESVTTQTDVYSLGVILYELLTGEHPHGFTDQDWQTLSPGQFRDRIANGEVIRPRRVSDRIDKELEALLLKALAHESSDRYSSAGDLATDINNYLTGEPLTAKAPTTMYFLRKRLHKYRVQVAIAATVLTAIIGMAVFAYVSVSRERNNALIAKDDANEARDDASEQRDNARDAASRANEAEDKAVAALQAESEQRRRVEKEVYRYSISEADRLSQEGMYGDARKLLGTLKPNLRGWEYGHLMCRSARRSFTELLTLKGHSDEVYSVAFSPDGKRLASGSSDKTIKLWDTVTGKELLTLKGHLSAVFSVAFSPDGERLASGSRDTTIKLWDTATGKEVLTLKEDLGEVYSVAFSPDGKHLASGSYGTIKLWDTATGKELFALKGRSGEVISIAFSPDGKRLASGDLDRTIRFWDTATGKELLMLKGHSGSVYSVVFSPDGKQLASGSWDRTIKLWDTVTGTELLTLMAQDRVRSLAFSPDGRRLASGSENPRSRGTIKLWDAVTGKELLSLAGHPIMVWSVAFSPDGKRLASGSWDGTIKLWDTVTVKELRTLKVHSWWDSVTFSPWGMRLASVCSDKTINIWDTATKELVTLKGHSDRVASIVFSTHGKRLASGSWDGTIKLWDTVTGKELVTLKGHSDRVASVAFSRDGKRLASGSWDGTIKLWDTVTGNRLLTLKRHSDEVYSVAFSPDGKQLASGSRDKTVKLWDTITGNRLLTLKGHSDEVYSVTFSPDGKQLVSGSRDGTIKLWDTATRRQVFTTKGHSEGVRSVAILPPGGRGLMSGSSDKTIKVWDDVTGDGARILLDRSDSVYAVAFSPDDKRLALGRHERAIIWDTVTGKELLALKGHSREVDSVAFSPDGNRLASGSADRTIKLWDAITGEELLTLNGHSSRVRSVAFSPDGNRLASGSADKTIKLWNTATGRALFTLKGHSAVISSVAFSPDGRRLASRSYDDTIKFWDTLTGEGLLTIGHSDVSCVAFSPDGNRLASGSRDKTIKLWDTITGKELLMLKGHSGQVSSVAFSSDGNRLASGCYDGSIILWNVATGKELLTLKGHSDRVVTVAFSRDGKRLASGSEDKTIKLWYTLDWTKSAKQIERERTERYPALSAPTTRPAVLCLRVVDTQEALSSPSVDMRFVRIEPGSFVMGCPDSEVNGPNFQQEHEVRLTKGLYMGVNEVTQEQYKAVMGTNPSHYKGDKSPVDNVSWNDAIAFCKKMSRMTGHEVRLPTDAQWEYACRAGTTTRFSFGDDKKDLDAYAWYAPNSNHKTHPVGLKKPNAWGLYDMHGNVIEWVSDRYVDYSRDSVTDPTFPGDGKGMHVLRGGSWIHDERGCRSAWRTFSRNTDLRSWDVGFRVICIFNPASTANAKPATPATTSSTSQPADREGIQPPRTPAKPTTRPAGLPVSYRVIPQ